ncbi:hypothetical protein ABZ826_09250 [Streptomyces sp. NPDC047515]|uniref:hypothetical protein n=1 Tax=Streptomyces sp. NPDC047515 TaxID=3155380 RepID=UPI003405BE20
MSVTTAVVVVVALARRMGVRVAVLVGGGQPGRDAVVAALAPLPPGIGHPLGEDPGQRGGRHQRTGAFDPRTRYVRHFGRYERGREQHHAGGAEQPAAPHPLDRIGIAAAERDLDQGVAAESADQTRDPVQLGVLERVAGRGGEEQRRGIGGADRRRPQPGDQVPGGAERFGEQAP